MGPRSIGARLTLWYTAAFTVGFIVLGAVMWLGVQRSLYHAIDDTLLERALQEPKADAGIRLCRGPLLSRAQYRVDVERWNYSDAREVPLGTMTPEEIDIWTKAIDEPGRKPGL